MKRERSGRDGARFVSIRFLHKFCFGSKLPGRGHCIGFDSIDLFFGVVLALYGEPFCEKRRNNQNYDSQFCLIEN